MNAIAGLVTGLLFGGMTAFSFLFSPMVFARLPAETAGPFIRQIFPWYFGAVTILFALATLLVVGPHPEIAILTALMAVLGAVNIWLISPRIDRARPGKEAGEPSATRRFALLHRASVAINLVQIIVAAIALAVIAG